jgi:hypothetical protein
MTPNKTKSVACYFDGLGITYWEVPLQDFVNNPWPVLYGHYAKLVDEYAVSIFDDVFVSARLTSEIPYRVIKTSEQNKKIYRPAICAHRCASDFISSVTIAVPYTCGCESYTHCEPSDRLYAIFIVKGTSVHVMSVDRVPAVVVARGLARCETTWLADVVTAVSEDMLRKNAQSDFEEFVRKHPSMDVIMRMCNGRFLKRVSMEDFMKHIKGGE